MINSTNSNFFHHIAPSPIVLIKLWFLSTHSILNMSRLVKSLIMRV